MRPARETIVPVKTAEVANSNAQRVDVLKHVRRTRHVTLHVRAAIAVNSVPHPPQRQLKAVSKAAPVENARNNAATTVQQPVQVEVAQAEPVAST